MEKHRNIRSVILFGLLPPLFSFSLISLTSGKEKAQNNSEFHQLVTNFNADARIIKKADIDTFCYSVDYPLVSNPGLVEADFNGDKKTDYAVLLQLGKPFDTVSILDGKQFKDEKAKVTLVVFMAEGNKKFKTITLVKDDDIEAYYPLNLYIEIQPSDTVRESEALEGGKKIYLDAPGILLVYCERSAVVIYWDKKTKKFDEIWVSD